ncbi:unnamed protein product [Arabis nemorensis]|uniref:Uncharacterized protein n=1 Tax=Arabis nemorensis TaxID=586526 RepID=A0A565CMV7_9BRAS|nr:unnamed protein product [Arabis nemorensis]
MVGKCPLANTLHSPLVRSFFVPVPKPILNTGAFNWSVTIGAGGLAAGLLSWPSKDVRIQHLVYTDFVLALVGYLAYQRPLWLAYVFIAALLLLNTFLFHGLLGLDFPEPEEEDEDESPV